MFLTKVLYDGELLGYEKNCGVCEICEGFLDAKRYKREDLKFNEIKDKYRKAIEKSFESPITNRLGSDSIKKYFPEDVEFERISFEVEEI